MIFNQCPICGRYMIPNMSETSGWYQCVCGYDSRSYVYTYSNHSTGSVSRMTRPKARYFFCNICGYGVQDLFEGNYKGEDEVLVYEKGKEWNYCPNCGAKTERKTE